MPPGMLNPQFNPQGSVAVITGGASGIGASLARALADRGAKRVVIADMNAYLAARTARSLPDGVGVFLGKCNASCETDIKALIEATERDVGPIDFFACNAGINSPGSGAKVEGVDIVDISKQAWDTMLGVNVLQIAYVAKHLVPIFAKRGGGHLLVVASAAGLLTQVGNMPYAVTKAAAVAMAEWLAVTYGGKKGLGISCLCPQGVRTAMTDNYDKNGAKLVVGPLTEPDEVAKVTLDDLGNGKFLVLPHEVVAEYIRRKGDDRDRWVKGMRKVQEKYEDTIAGDPLRARL